MQRWALILLAYDFDIEYLNTLKFGHVDVLSRLINRDTDSTEDRVIASISFDLDINQIVTEAVNNLSVTYETIVKATYEVELLQNVIKYQQTVRPYNIQEEDLKTLHHRRDSIAHINGWLLMSERLIIPFMLHMDYAGLFENKYFLVVVDSCSKWPEIFILQTITTSETINKLNEIFARYGLPHTIITDNGTQFTAHVFQNFCIVNGISHIRSPPFHPQSNGQAERFVEIFKRALSKMKGEGPTSDNLQIFQRCYHTTPNASINTAKPAEIMFGKKIRIPLVKTNYKTINHTEQAYGRTIQPSTWSNK